MVNPVTVVIPVRNEYDLLVRAVQSAAPQAAEVMIALDCSDKTTKKTAEELILSFDNVGRCETKAAVPSGVCYARNLAISAATYDLIFPCDADDTIAENGIAEVFDAWAPGTFVYGGWNDVENSNTIPHPLPAPVGMATKKHIAHGRMLFHRDDWLRVGGYNPRFEMGYEDWAFTLALLAAGVKGVRINKIVENYYRHARGRTPQAVTQHEILVRMMKTTYPLAFR